MNARRMAAVVALLLPGVVTAIADGAGRAGGDRAAGGAVATRTAPPAADSAASAAASDDSGAALDSIQFAEADTLRLLVRAETTRFVALIHNGGPATAVVDDVQVVLRDSSSTALAGVLGALDTSARSREIPVAAHRVTMVPIRLSVPTSARPQDGYLVMRFTTGRGEAFSRSRPVRVVAAPVPRSWEQAGWTVIGPALAAAVAPFVAAVLIGLAAMRSARPAAAGGGDDASGVRSEAAAPSDEAPEWDPTMSWASNLAVAGGIVTALLATTALPEEPRYFGKGGYGVLAALFAGLIGIAPAVHVFVARLSERRVIRAAAVLLSSFVTLWGAFGEGTTTWSLFREFEAADVLPQRVVAAVGWLLLGIGTLLFLYAVKSMVDTGVAAPEPTITPKPPAPRSPTPESPPRESTRDARPRRRPRLL